MSQRIAYRNTNNDLASETTIFKLLLFVLNPCLAFVVSLFSVKKKSSYLIFFLFGMVFCWSMYMRPVMMGQDGYIDFVNITYRFYNQADMTFSQLIDAMADTFNGTGGGEKDLYNLMINWITMQFSRNYHLMYVIASVPFSYFMLKSLWTITSDNVRFRNSLICFLILALFILPKDIFNVQNFRYSTATWIAVYAMLKIFYYGEKKKYILIALTPLIHASFWFLVLVVIVYLLTLKRNPKMWLTIYWISIPFAFFSSDLLGMIDVSVLPDFLSRWAESFLSDSAVKEYGMDRMYSGSGFFWVSVIIALLKMVMIALAPVVIWKSGNINSQNQKSFFTFFIAYAAFVNFVQVVPVLGSRFYGVGLIMLAFLWFKTMIHDIRYRKYFYIYCLLYCFDVYKQTIPHYAKVLDARFFFSDLVSLIVHNLGVTHYV